MAEVVFRSTHPDVLAAIAQHREDMADWHTRAAALLAEIGFPDRSFIISTALGSRWIAGVETVRGGEVAPSGWRVADRVGHQVLLPDKRLKAGKAVAERIEQTHPPADVRSELPGMPSDRMAGRGVLIPELREMGGAVWVKWRSETVPGVDGAVWEQVPLSKYWAAREAQDAEGVTSDG